MERLTIEKIKSLKEAMRSNMNVYFYDDVMKVFDELLEKRNAEEQGLILRLPCKLGDIIGRIISHNETVTLMFETEVSSFRGLKHFWHGAAWNIPKEYLELPFVKIHGVVPDKITEADTIWIEVRKEAEQALARMEGAKAVSEKPSKSAEEQFRRKPYQKKGENHGEVLGTSKKA